MSTQKLSNVSLADFKSFLSKAGCKYINTEGGHEKWTRSDLTRPIIVQTHLCPVPEFIVRNALRNLSLKKKEFFEILFECPNSGGKEDNSYTDVSIEEIKELAKAGKKQKK